ncbi:MAG: response regulator [Thaumarchaeota archaeon]|nr:response regulator [Nitrososphaerota archaeon]
MKVLLIDDNETITEMLSKCMSMKNHQCISTNDGRIGLKLISEKKFDVVLLDLVMPDFSGVDIIDHLHKSGEISKHKIILFTASSVTDSEIDALIKKGVHSCLKKPVKLSTLMQTIEI